MYRWGGHEVPLHGNRTRYLTAGASPGSELDRSVVGPKLATVSQVGGVNNAARYMVRLQRRVAERERRAGGTNSVGEDAMVVSIPANLKKRDGMLLMSTTDSDAVHGGVRRTSALSKREVSPRSGSHRYWLATGGYPSFMPGVTGGTIKSSVSGGASILQPVDKLAQPTDG